MTNTPDHLEIARVLMWAGFTEFRRVSGRLAVSDLYEPAKRTGIYVLGFRDGTYYVGKATDVTNRFRDHRDSKDPVERMSFRKVNKSALDRVERDTISVLEFMQVPLKNIASTRTGAPQDRSAREWATVDEIRRFVSDVQWNDLSGEPIDDPSRRIKMRDRFELLTKYPGADQVFDALALYLLRCVPFPARTAYQSWVISALPAGYDRKAIANLTIGWQWAAIAFEDAHGPLMQFYARGSVLRREYGRDLDKALVDVCDVYPATETMGGTDQLRLVCKPNETGALLERASVVRALREVAVDLMERRTPHAQNHCFDLADLILTRARRFRD